jgi:inhibitor of KinA sporulation pathway (predicted exonuclease)
MTENLPKYIGVLDFEATCDDGGKFMNEVIEFPTVLLKWNAQLNNYELVGEFQDYCKPVKNIQLTKFCTGLTGITQEQVDNGLPFNESLDRHYKWIKSHLENDDSFVFLTCGKWDLDVMMVNECKRWKIVPPKIYRTFINIKSELPYFYKLDKQMGMDGMLKYLNMKLIGHHHSGIDDCRNIARIWQELVKKGHYDPQYITVDSKKYT